MSWPNWLWLEKLRGRRLDDNYHSAGRLVSGSPIGNGVGNRLIDVIRVERESDIRPRRHFGQHLGQAGQKQETEGTVNIDPPVLRLVAAIRLGLDGWAYHPAQQNGYRDAKSNSHTL